MKKIKILSVNLFAFFALLMLSACTDLDLHPEGGIMDDDQLKETTNAIPDRANATLAGMYSWLGTSYALYFDGMFSTARADDFGYPAVCLSTDLNSGDMVNIVSGYDWFTVSLDYSDRTPNYANPYIRMGLFYKILYSAKLTLDMMPDSISDPTLLAMVGQAKAMRAFAYLSLAPYFQFKYKGNEDKPSVPMLLDNVDYRNNPRVPLSQLYEAIIQDLTDAIADLDGFVRSNKGQIDQQVAYGLRARAYLYMEEWDKAAADADMAMAGYTPYSKEEISMPGFDDAKDHNWMWAAIIPSGIAQDYLATWPSQIGSFSGNAYVPYAAIYRCINKLLYDKIPTSDVRRNWWLGANLRSPNLLGLTWTDPITGHVYAGYDIPLAVIPDVKQPMQAYTNIKFGQRAGIGSPYNDGDWCMMRVEEMILIKAEATAKAGNLPDGKQILEDFVRNYRNPSYTSVATDVNSFSDEVFFQRRIEFWGEGFAMADKMRLGKNIVRYHPSVATNVPELYQFNIASTDPWLLLRFVQGETSNNSAIVQNEGSTQPIQGDGATLLDGVTD